MKEYGSLLADDPGYADRAASFASKVRDVTELLAELEPIAPRRPIAGRLAYHDACHLAHAQGVHAEPRVAAAGRSRSLEVTEIPEAAICCGSAGVWNVLNPGPAAELGDRKARDVLATNAALLVTANPGCLMQVAAAVQRRGGRIALAHTARVLDASIRGLGVDELTGR